MKYLIVIGNPVNYLHFSRSPSSSRQSPQRAYGRKDEKSKKKKKDRKKRKSKKKRHKSRSPSKKSRSPILDLDKLGLELQLLNIKERQRLIDLTIAGIPNEDENMEKKHKKVFFSKKFNVNNVSSITFVVATTVKMSKLLLF